MKLFFFLLVFGFTNLCLAQNNSNKYRFVFQGTVAGKKVELGYFPDKNDGKVAGEYKYAGSKEYISFTGTSIDKSGYFEQNLSELFNKKVTGTWTGKLEKGVMKGTWKGNSGVFPYELNLVQVNEIISFSMQEVVYKRSEKSEIHYPEIQTATQSKMISIAQKDMDALLKEAVGETSASVKGIADMSDCETCYQNDFIDISTFGKILSVSISTEGYGGGAHGYDGMKIIHRFIDTGAEIKLNNILSEEGISIAKKLLQKDLEKTYQTKDLVAYGYDGFIDGFKLSNYYSFDIDGIHFSYGRYEVGPWAIPPPEGKVLWSDLLPYIQKGYGILRK